MTNGYLNASDYMDDVEFGVEANGKGGSTGQLTINKFTVDVQ